MKFQAQSQNAAAIARRENLINGNVSSVIVADFAAATVVTSALSVGPSVDFATAPAYRPNSPHTITIRGRFSAIAGGSCTGVDIILNSPIGVPIASQRVPFGDVSGFCVTFDIAVPVSAVYSVDYQLVGISAVPTVTISEQFATLKSYGAQTLVTTLTI